MVNLHVIVLLLGDVKWREETPGIYKYFGAGNNRHWMEMWASQKVNIIFRILRKKPQRGGTPPQFLCVQVSVVGSYYKFLSLVLRLWTQFWAAGGVSGCFSSNRKVFWLCKLRVGLLFGRILVFCVSGIWQKVFQWFYRNTCLSNFC